MQQHNLGQAELKCLFDLQQNSWPLPIQKTIKGRQERLWKLYQTVEAYREKIHQALKDDYQKHPTEVDITEIYPIFKEIRLVMKNLARWSKAQRVSTPLTLVGTKGWIRREAKGIVLIISPWNFPVNLSLIPLISAVAAGNSVILKPSELTPHASRCISDLLSEVFPPEEVVVVQGDASVSSALLEFPFNHIFFTGSPAIGKIVMTKAAQHLTPVTLELGGKSPVIVDRAYPLEKVVERVAWSKSLNNGQICIAPDTIFIPEESVETFTKLYQQALIRLYGSQDYWAQNKDYNRIVNFRHWKRLTTWLKEAIDSGAKVLVGGHYEESTHYLSPTLVNGVTSEMTLGKEEIFGPILPLIPYKNLEEVFYQIKQHDFPLALYLFTEKTDVEKLVLEKVRSGGVCINHNVIQFSHPHLPFGGVQTSGLGQTHGYAGFKAFTHERSVLKQQWSFSLVSLTYPPYKAWVQTLVRFLMKWF
jgi:aldehyde dehydrogenase (NAD+)